MADRFYILPMITDGRRQPKYLLALPYQWGAKDYGSEDVCIALVRDITEQDHDVLDGYSDVISIPENLDLNMTTNQVNGAVSFYESLNIPADWINTNRTVLEVVKITVALFQFNQVWRGNSGTRHSSPFNEGLDLSTTYNELSELNKGRVLVTMDKMQVDTSGLTGSSTIRDAMRIFAIEVANRPLKIAAIEF